MSHVNSYLLPLLFDGVEGANVGGAEQEDEEEDEEVEEENEGEDDVLMPSGRGQNYFSRGFRTTDNNFISRADF